MLLIDFDVVGKDWYKRMRERGKRFIVWNLLCGLSLIVDIGILSLSKNKVGNEEKYCIPSYYGNFIFIHVM